MKTSVTPVQISNLLKWFGWVLLFLFLWLKGCGPDCGKTTTNVKVTVPEVKGTFKPKQPKHEPITEQSLSKSSSKVRLKNPKKDDLDIQNDSLISELLAENEKLSRDFYFASDSLKKLKYQKAIQLNLFTETFEDDNVKIDMSGIVRGEVKSIQPFYTKKERKIDVPVPVTEFRLLAGGGVGLNKELNQGLYKLNIGFQNQKGNIIRAGYMQIGNQSYGVAEYDFSIFSIKK